MQRRRSGGSVSRAVFGDNTSQEQNVGNAAPSPVARPCPCRDVAGVATSSMALRRRCCSVAGEVTTTGHRAQGSGSGSRIVRVVKWSVPLCVVWVRMSSNVYRPTFCPFIVQDSALRALSFPAVLVCRLSAVVCLFVVCLLSFWRVLSLVAVQQRSCAAVQRCSSAATSSKRRTTCRRSTTTGAAAQRRSKSVQRRVDAAERRAQRRSDVPKRQTTILRSTTMGTGLGHGLEDREGR